MATRRKSIRRPARAATKRKRARGLPYPQNRALSPLDLSAAEIQQLGSSVDDYVKHALRALGATVEAGPDPRLPDGGVDLVVERATATDIVPAGRSQWGITSQNFMKRDKLKSWVKKLGAASLALSSSASCIGVVTDTRHTGNKSFVKEAKELGVTLVDADQLAAFLSRVPAVRLSGALKPSWAHANPASDVLQSMRVPVHLEDETRQAFARKFRDQRERGQATRLEGFAGIGKTRLALEVVAADPEVASIAVYFAEFRDAEFDRLVEFVNASEHRSVFIVVDECSRAQSTYCELKSGPRIGVLTVGLAEALQAPSSKIGSISPFSEAEIGRFLEAKGVDAAARNVLVSQCRGFIKAAEFLADRLPTSLTPTELANLVNHNQLFSSALGDDARVLEILSLLSEVSTTDQAILLQAADTNPTRFEEVRNRHRAAGIIQNGADGLYITPHVLADSLALRSCANYEQLVPQWFRRLTEAGQTAMLMRLLPLAEDHQQARAVVRAILGGLPPPTPGADGERSLRLRALASERFPALVRELTSGLLTSMRDEDLTALSQALVAQLIENWLIDEDSFEVCADILIRIAPEDRGPYLNGARGLWRDLFTFGLARTAAANERRIAYLESCVASNTPSRSELAIEALTTLIDFGHASIATSRSELAVRRPGDEAQLEHLARFAIDALVALRRNQNEGVAASAEHALIRSLRSLLLFVPTLVLERFEQIVPQEALETRASLRRELEILGRRSDLRPTASLAATLGEMRSKLEPRTFRERLRQWVGDFLLVDEREADLSGHLIALAEELLNAPSLLEPERKWLFSGNPSRPYAFAFWLEVGKRDAAAAFLPPFLEELSAGNALLEVGAWCRGHFLAGREAFVWKLLEQLPRMPHGSMVACDVVLRLPPSERGLRLVLEHASTQAVSWKLIGMRLPHWATSFSAEIWLQLLALAQDEAAKSLASGMVAATHHWEEAHPADPLMGRVRERAVELLPQLADTNMLTFWRPLTRSVDRDVVLRALRSSIVETTSWNTIRELASIVLELASPLAENWAGVGELLLSVDARLRIEVGMRGVYATRMETEEVLLPWSSKHPERVVLLAELASMQGTDMPPLAESLLKLGIPEVTGALTRRFHGSVVVWGELADHFKGQHRQIEGWLHSATNSHVRAWCRAQLKNLQRLLPSRAA